MLTLNEQRVRLYYCVHICTNLNVLLLLTQYEAVISPTCVMLLSKYTTCRRVLPVDKQCVRFYCCLHVCVHKFDSIIVWRSMQYEVVISPSCTILLSKYTTMPIMTLTLC